MSILTLIALALTTVRAEEPPPTPSPEDAAPSPEEAATPVEDAEPAPEQAASVPGEVEADADVGTPGTISFPEALPPSSSRAPVAAPQGWRSIRERRERDLPDNSAMIGLGVAYGAYVGGTTGWLIGEAAESSEADHTTEGILPGVLVGAGIGGGVAYLVSQKQILDAPGAAHMASTTTLGAFTGGQLGRLLIPPSDDGAYERAHAAALAGSIAGAGAGLLTLDSAPDLLRTGSIDLAAGVGFLAATGVSDMAGLSNRRDRQERAAVALTGTALMTTVGVLAARGEHPLPSPPTLGLAMAQGAWIGAMSPYIFDETPSGRTGLRLGVGLGYGVALATSGLGNPTPRSIGLQAMGAAAGNALGAGIPLSMDWDGHARGVVLPALAGGLAGQALGAAIAPHADLSPNQVYTLSVMQMWTAGNAAGWTAYASQSGPSGRAAGYGLATLGAGTLATMGLAPVIDIEPSSSTLMLTSGGWGTLVGVTGGAALGLKQDEQWLSGMLVGDAALIGVGAVAAAGIEPSWGDVGTINGMGALGAAGGGLTGVIFLYDEDDWRPMMGAVAVGTTAGLATGAVLAATSKDRGPDLSLQLPSLRSRTTTYEPRLSLQPMSDQDGNLGGMVQLNVDELMG